MQLLKRAWLVASCKSTSALQAMGHVQQQQQRSCLQLCVPLLMCDTKALLVEVFLSYLEQRNWCSPVPA